MKNTTTPCISLQGSSARNRRYNSIAVGFPIRNDQKAHSQRVSKGFPSWVGARCAYTYVQGRENCVLSNTERLNKSITGAYIRLAFDAFTPNERPKKCPRKPTQRPITSPRCTTQRLTTSPRCTTQRLISSTRCTTQRLTTSPRCTTQRLTTSPRCTTQRLTTSPRCTTQRLTTSPRCTTKQPTFNPRSYPGSLAIHLRFTWESLDAAQYSSSTGSPYIPGKITNISWFIHNSLIVRLNATFNHPSARAHCM